MVHHDLLLGRGDVQRHARDAHGASERMERRHAPLMSVMCHQGPGRRLQAFVVALFLQYARHAVRRLRHRAWLNLGQEMRPLQHALLRARMPGAALERGRPRPALQKIKKAGGAEQYNANKKYAEAVAVAAEACAEDTKGQTCYICTQALHWKTKEGLVRMCACRGTAGFAHVSCLAEQAKILVAEAEENNLGDKVLNERWERWHTCSLCEQDYHGVVRCALGWACWKTYVGRPETDWARTWR